MQWPAMKAEYGESMAADMAERRLMQNETASGEKK